MEFEFLIYFRALSIMILCISFLFDPSDPYQVFRIMPSSHWEKSIFPFFEAFCLLQLYEQFRLSQIKMYLFRFRLVDLILISVVLKETASAKQIFSMYRSGQLKKRRLQLIHNWWIWASSTSFLWARYQISFLGHWDFPNDKVSVNTTSSKPQCYKKSDGSQDDRSPDIPD